MVKIYSKTQPDLLCHLVRRVDEILSRENVADDDQFLQLATLRMNKGHSFRPHQHVWKPVEYQQTIAQESWCVIKGRVQVSFFDIDGQLLAQEEIGPGDCSMTFQGGHNYLILEDDTVVYEYKTGPYYGQSKDKVFI